MSNTSNGFWNRWQARRDAVAAEEAAEQLHQAKAAIASKEQVQPEAEAYQADLPANADDDTAAGQAPEAVAAEPLPDPESIEIGGSFARFMAKDVDPAARTKALRALWRQPQYNEVDGLLEYALDYTKHPKLSADVSAELTKRVFQHLADKVAEGAEAMLAEGSPSRAGSGTEEPSPASQRLAAKLTPTLDQGTNQEAEAVVAVPQPDPVQPIESGDAVLGVSNRV